MMRSVCWPMIMAMQVAAQSPASPPATHLDDVVINGRALQDSVDAFVADVTSPPPGHGPARWDRRICVGVVNLHRDAAEVVIESVSHVASRIGLEAAGPGCSPNILVIATDDGRSLANALIEAKPRAFRPAYSGASQSAEALEAFRSSDQAVRWWHVSLPVVRDSGVPAVRLPGQERGPVIPGNGRLTTEVTNRLLRSFVILDITKLVGLNFQQVGDYVAMVALAQIDPDADTTRFDTVLNLFSDPAHGETLTDWDVSYLTAMYGSYMNQKNPAAQVRSVGSLMIRDRRAATREGPDEAPPTPASETP